MGYYRPRPRSGPLPSKDELIASIRNGSFLANANPLPPLQRRAEWINWKMECAIDKYLFMGPPTYAEYCRDNNIIELRGDGVRGQNWDDRYDSLGRFHPEWHD